MQDREFWDEKVNIMDMQITYPHWKTNLKKIRLIF